MGILKKWKRRAVDLQVLPNTLDKMGSPAFKVVKRRAMWNHLPLLHKAWLYLRALMPGRVW